MPVLGGGGGWVVRASGSTSVANAATVDVTISTTKYSTDEAYVVASCRSGTSFVWPDYPLNSPTRWESFTASARLTSDTNVRVEGGAGYGSDLVSNAVVDWYVVELA